MQIVKTNNKIKHSKYNIGDPVTWENKHYIISDISYYIGLDQFLYWLFPTIGRDVADDELTPYNPDEDFDKEYEDLKNSATNLTDNKNDTNDFDYNSLIDKD